MIKIEVEAQELWNNQTLEFEMTKSGTYRFEDSLHAISLWEAKWELPFFTTEMTNEQLMDYYYFMCLDDDFEREQLTAEVTYQLYDYRQLSHTATRIQNDNKGPRSSKIITSEVVYAMMANGQVPFECDKWNIDRLMMLLGVLAESQSEPKKMSKQEILEQNQRINAERKKKYNTKG